MNEMNSDELSQRTKLFALEIIRFYKDLPKTEEARILGKQLIRSATSIAANYRAARRARSENDYYSKICIVVEESDESLFWLELLKEAEINSTNRINELMKEAQELLKIFSVSRKTLKNRISDKK